MWNTIRGYVKYRIRKLESNYSSYGRGLYNIVETQNSDPDFQIVIIQKERNELNKNDEYYGKWTKLHWYRKKISNKSMNYIK